MRSVAILVLLLLAGCTSVRKGLEDYDRIVERGIGFNPGVVDPDRSSPASPGTATPADPALPATLGGDSANRAWEPAPPN